MRDRPPFHCHACGRWHDFPMCWRTGEPGEQLSFDDYTHDQASTCKHSKKLRVAKALRARLPLDLQLPKPIRTILVSGGVL